LGTPDANKLHQAADKLTEVREKDSPIGFEKLRRRREEEGCGKNVSQGTTSMIGSSSEAEAHRDCRIAQMNDRKKKKSLNLTRKKSLKTS